MINGRVNEKLYFAKLTLDAAEQADDAMSSALLEAAAMQLFCAYRCYLHEMVGGPHDAISSAVEIAATSLSQPSANFDELLILERQSSWLSQLLSAYRDVIALEQKRSKSVAALTLIDVDVQLTIENCRAWLTHLRELIERQREHAQEW